MNFTNSIFLVISCSKTEHSMELGGGRGVGGELGRKSSLSFFFETSTRSAASSLSLVFFPFSRLLSFLSSSFFSLVFFLLLSLGLQPREIPHLLASLPPPRKTEGLALTSLLHLYTSRIQKKKKKNRRRNDSSTTPPFCYYVYNLFCPGETGRFSDCTSVSFF